MCLTQQSSSPQSKHETSNNIAYDSMSNDPSTFIVQHQVTGNVVKMLIVSNINNNNQRLITLEIPEQNCTVQDLLDIISDQITIFDKITVSLVDDPIFDINYIVEGELSFSDSSFSESSDESSFDG